MTKLEIINETVEYYAEDVTRRATRRRATRAGTCEYQTADGRMCAVGRCMLKPSEDMKNAIAQLCCNGKALNAENELKPQYRGHGLDFWGYVQRLHDVCRNWGEHGLSQVGEHELSNLRRLYSKE